MHVYLLKMSTDYIRDFYSHPQTGGGFSVYTGTRRQLGGSFLSGLARIALPILKFLGARALNIGKNVATDVVVNKKPFTESIKTHAKDEVKKVLTGRGKKRRISVMHINKSKVPRRDIFN